MADILRKGAFMFGTTNMWEQYGILVESVEDNLLPGLRERKISIPDRSGLYDFGAKYYDERELVLSCGSVELLTRAQARELAYTLSVKNRIVLWDEPDNYYLGRVYGPTDLERVLRTLRKFQLVFVCDPFAYSQEQTADFQGLEYIPVYHGTAETPTRLQIVNTGAGDVTGIQIIVTERKETY